MPPHVVHIVRHVYVISYRVFVQSIKDRILLRRPGLSLPSWEMRAQYRVWRHFCIKGKVVDLEQFLDVQVENYLLDHSFSVPISL